MNLSSESGLPPSLESLFEDTPQIHQLENGLTLVYQVVPGQPVVSSQVWIRTGSIHEQGHLGSGLSHFLEHMLFKGTDRRGPGEIAREAQMFGGQINAYTAYERTVYYIDGPSEGLEKALDLLADMVFHATLPAEEVRKEREVILREIDMTLDDPDRILSRSLFTTAYREHPFRYPVIGHRPLFEQVDREILHRYYRARYQPENTVLAVAGQFDPQSLVEAVEGTFGDIPVAPLQPVGIQEEPDQLAPRENRSYGDFQIARGLMGYKVPSMRHSDAPALDLLAAIMGSGNSGRLRQKLREDLGLVSDIMANCWNPRQPGLFSIRYQCPPEKAEKAEEAIQAMFSILGEAGFTEPELEKARQFACLSEVQARQTSSGMASRLGLITAVVGDLQYPKRYFRRLFSLNTHDLAEVAGRSFRPESLSRSTLLPESRQPARAAASRSAPALPEFKEHRLDNGARLFWQRDPRLPRVWMRFAGLGGPLYEDADRRGATRLLATLLARDTRYQTAYQVAQDLESKGGLLLESSGNNTFSLAVEIAPEFARDGLRVLRDAVLHPAFNPATIQREREAQLTEIREIQDEIVDFGRLVLRRHFFGEHPFSSDPNGTLESVEAIDKACLRSLYKRLIVGSNSALVVTGNFDPDTLLPHLEAFLAQLPDWHFRSRNHPFADPATTGEITEVLNREQAVVFDAYPDVGFKPEREIVGEVLDELLSDMSGPLFMSVRENQSLAYFVGASRLLGYNYGSFFLYAGTQPGQVGKVFDCFDHELNRIRGGQITPEELQATTTRLKIQNRFSLQTAANRAARVALNALYHKPIMDWVDYEDRLNAVTIEDLQAFATTWLVPEKRLRLTITPDSGNPVQEA